MPYLKIKIADKKSLAHAFKDFLDSVYQGDAFLESESEKEAQIYVNVPGDLKQEDFEKTVGEWCKEHDCSYELVDQAPEAPSPQRFPKNLKLIYPKAKNYETLVSAPRKLEKAKLLWKKHWKEEFDENSEEDREEIVALYNEYMEELSKWKPVVVRLKSEKRNLMADAPDMETNSGKIEHRGMKMKPIKKEKDMKKETKTKDSEKICDVVVYAPYKANLEGDFWISEGGFKSADELDANDMFDKDERKAHRFASIEEAKAFCENHGIEDFEIRDSKKIRDSEDTDEIAELVALLGEAHSKIMEAYDLASDLEREDRIDSALVYAIEDLEAAAGELDFEGVEDPVSALLDQYGLESDGLSEEDESEDLDIDFEDSIEDDKPGEKQMKERFEGRSAVFTGLDEYDDDEDIVGFPEGSKLREHENEPCSIYGLAIYNGDNFEDCYWMIEFDGDVSLTPVPGVALKLIEEDDDEGDWQEYLPEEIHLAESDLEPGEWLE